MHHIAAMVTQLKDIAKLRTEHRAAHRRDVTGVSFNSDGSFIAAAGDSSTTVVFDIQRAAPYSLGSSALHTCDGHSKNIECVTWHPTGKNLLASVGMDKLLNVYDLRVGSTAVRSISADHGCLKVSWAPDNSGTMLVSDCKDNLYRVEKSTTEMKPDATVKNNIEINEFAWGRKSDRLYVARGDGRLAVLRWPTLERIAIVDAHTERCFAVAVDPTERYFAVTSQDTTFSFWHAESLSNIYVCDRFESTVRLAAFSHDSQLLALADENSRIALIQAASGAPVHTIRTSENVNCIAWHPSHRLLAYSLDRSGREQPVSTPNFNVWGY